MSFEVFISYSHKDKALLDELAKHLSNLRRQELISDWFDGNIIPGTEWEKQILEHLNTAKIILLLISADFMASDFCYSVEMKQAIARHDNNEARVIPIILRSTDWEGAPFAKLQILPIGAQPVSRWSSHDDAFENVVKGIRRAIRDLKEQDADLAPRDTYRQRLIAKVKAIWIADLLEQSLHGATLIALGLKPQADAIDPWRLVLQLPNQLARPLPDGTRITEVYDRAASELLILGEPGSGKTTLMLELARDLLDRARLDDAHPIPVVFNLSSWAIRDSRRDNHPNSPIGQTREVGQSISRKSLKRQTIVSWLVDELNTKYQVPPKLGQTWVDTDQVLLLLDGLDEMSEIHREVCIQAINVFHQEHSLVPIVVCSRSKEYFWQTTRVALNSAVTVQPLSADQIKMYLSSADKELEGLRKAWHNDPTLQELVTTPLMLSILALTYHGKSLEEIQVEGSSTGIRQIFENYIQSRLQRSSPASHYTPQQTIHWLTWLAQEMKRHNQTVFYLEGVQLDWLPQGWLHPVYYTLVCSIVGLIFGLLFGLIAWLILGLAAGPATGLVGALISGLGARLLFKQERLLFKQEIQPAEILAWSWRGALRRRNLTITLSVGLGTGLAAGLGARQSGDQYGLLGGVLFGLICVVTSIWLSGVSRNTLKKSERITPNEGIRRSARYSRVAWILGTLSIWLSGGLISWLGGGLISGLGGGLKGGLLLVLVGGPIFGLVCALCFGGLACIQHVILRLLLWLAGHTPRPWNYLRLLDDATRYILLRKVGGGYIFIHRLLLEHFASLGEKEH